MKIALAANARQRKFDPDAAAIFARFTTEPTRGRKFHIDDLVVALKAAGIWGKIDVLVTLAGADSQAAAQNWKGAFCNATLVNAPVFTVDRGYEGVESGGHCVNTNFIPATHGANFQTNSAYIGAWSLFSANDSNGGALLGVVDGPSSDIYVHGRSGGAASFALNSGQNEFFASSDGSGFFAACRTASNAMVYYRNQTLLGTSADASGGLATLPVYAVGRNQSGSTVDVTGSQLAAYVFAGALTQAEHNALEAALRTYLVAIGAA